MSLHNDPSGVNAYTRRLFLGKSLAFASASACVPSFIQSSAVNGGPENSSTSNSESGFRRSI